jgi:Ca2+-binding RTX toxin-like protein
MRTRLARLSALMVALLSLLTISQQQAGAVEKPTCYNPKTGQFVVATKWLREPGTLKGTNGPDVLVGSTGVDTIYGLSGDDVICSEPDGGTQGLYFDAVDGGPGNDVIFGEGTGTGGPGNDYIYVTNWYSDVTGGSGNDLVWVDGGKSDGGSGNDIVFGYHSRELLGGPGNDWVANMESGPTPPLMDCGSATDHFVANGATQVRRCEKASDFCEFPEPFPGGPANLVEASDVSIQC